MYSYTVHIQYSRPCVLLGTGSAGMSPGAAARAREALERERAELLNKTGLAEEERDTAKLELERRENELLKAQWVLLSLSHLPFSPPSSSPHLSQSPLTFSQGTACRNGTKTQGLVIKGDSGRSQPSGEGGAPATAAGAVSKRDGQTQEEGGKTHKATSQVRLRSHV